jgi:hypothetical protein
MQVTSTQLNIKSKREDSGELSLFHVYGALKSIRVFLLSLVFVCIGSNVFADSLVINYSNNKRLYKWDGSNLINYNNNKKLYKWDGSNIANYSTKKKLYKWDGSNLINYNNNKKLYKWDGSNIANYRTNKKLYKLNENIFSVYSTNKKLLKIDGLIPIPILIILVTGLL